MPLKSKRISAFAVKCMDTKNYKGTKSKKKTTKPKGEDAEVDEKISVVQHEKELRGSKTKKPRKTRRGKQSPQKKSENLGATVKGKKKEKCITDNTEKVDSDVIIVEMDSDNDEDVGERLASEVESNIESLQGDVEETQIENDDSHDSCVQDTCTNKRKSLDNDEYSSEYKKLKTDLNEKNASQISPQKNTEENDAASTALSDIGRRLRSWAGYGEHGDIVQSSMDDEHTKKPTVIHVDGGVLVIAPHPFEFPLKGFVTVQSLIGVAGIMGYKFEPECQGQNVYSPDCNSLVTVQTIEGHSDIDSAVSRIDSRVSCSNRTVTKLLRGALSENKPFVVLKFDKFKTALPSFISNYHPYTSIFRVKGQSDPLNKHLVPLSVRIPDYNDEVPRLSIPEQLQSVLDVWKDNLTEPNEGQPVILVCGGKDSGKSTSTRLLINTTLNLCDSVYYLECDIGQTEFTPPGVISLVKVTSPVLGPPFTHQRKTVCSYHYGSVTPKDNPDLYVRCLQLCVQEYHRVQQNKPLIVNTMGWMKGLGWQLLLDIVRLVSPSIIVQLISNLNSQNVESVMLEDLKLTSWTDISMMFPGEKIVREINREPVMLHLETPVSTSYNFKMKSTDYRNLAILSHLGDDLEPGLTLTSKIPFTVSWKDIAIHMRHVEVPRSQVMYALNASLVALCEGDISEAELYDDDGPLFLKKNRQPFRWHGYGLVRGIDMIQKTFYIVTSQTEDELARVNVLDIGGISLPENFLITQKGDKVLYVDEVVRSFGLSAVRQRKHMPRKNIR